MLKTGKRALVGVVAGGAWITWAGISAHSIGTPMLVALISIGILLLVGCVYCVLRGRSALRGQSQSPGHRINWGFLATSILEGLGVGAVIVLAQKAGRGDLLPDWIGLVIGLHFFLLARVFRESFYNLTAAAITIWCILSLVVFRGDSLTVAVGMGIGAILWTTAGVRLWRILILQAEGRRSAECESGGEAT